MIEVTRQDKVAVVKLVHGKANALDLELCDAIAARFDELRNTPDQAIVLRGACSPRASTCRGWSTAARTM